MIHAAPAHQLLFIYKSGKHTVDKLKHQIPIFFAPAFVNMSEIFNIQIHNDPFVKPVSFRILRTQLYKAFAAPASGKRLCNRKPLPPLVFLHQMSDQYAQQNHDSHYYRGINIHMTFDLGHQKIGRDHGCLYPVRIPYLIQGNKNLLSVRHHRFIDLPVSFQLPSCL